jgi:hypothetical protein
MYRNQRQFVSSCEARGGINLVLPKLSFLNKPMAYVMSALSPYLQMMVEERVLTEEIAQAANSLPTEEL